MISALPCGGCCLKLLITSETGAIVRVCLATYCGVFMNIYVIDEALVDQGRAAFSKGARQYLCGSAVPGYQVAKARKGGIQIVPGAIVAALELGLRTEEEIVPTVAKISRCWPTTVSAILETLAEDRVADRLWAQNPDGTYRVTRNAKFKPFTIMAS
jgi:hypothetical protein